MNAASVSHPACGRDIGTDKTARIEYELDRVNRG
jgi:hypothetical protein